MSKPTFNPKAFAQKHHEKVKKSLDFVNSTVAIDTMDQHHAEETANPENVNWMYTITTDMLVGDVVRASYYPGDEEPTLTICKKDVGLYSAFWSDQDGQVVEKYENTTLEILAKDLEHKGYLPKQEIPVAVLQPVPALSTPTVIRITLGEVQIEIMKSLNNISEDLNPDKNIKKALRIFKKSTSPYLSLKDEKAAVQEILENWNLHGERFNQILFAVEQMYKAQGKRK